MTWARIDDSFYTHRKIRRAWHRSQASIGLHAFAIAYAADHTTDGHVPPEFVMDQLPDDEQRKAAIEALIEAGLWRQNGDGYYIHDFLDYNPSRADLTARREADRERKRKESGRPDG